MSLRIEAQRIDNSKKIYELDNMIFVVTDMEGRERISHKDYSVVQAYKDGWTDAELYIRLGITRPGDNKTYIPGNSVAGVCPRDQGKSCVSWCHVDQTDFCGVTKRRV